jgi:hypothetical protein
VSIVRTTPATPTTSNGAARGWPSSTSCSPNGSVANVIWAVTGDSDVVATAGKPVESVALRMTS